jgi:hypothetical protein
MEINKSLCGNGKIHDETSPETSLDKDYRVNGESNYNYCVDDIKELFNKKECEHSNGACSFANSFANGYKNTSFIALSSFSQMMESTAKLMRINLTQMTMDQFILFTKNICEKSLNEVF